MRFVFLLFAGFLLVSQQIEAAEWGTEIYISLWENKLYLLKNDRISAVYPVATGKDRTPTPIGDFKIIKKSKNWGKGFGTRWLGLNVPWGKYGIHGTNRPWLVGKHASSGCIRMKNDDVEELYEKVSIGTPVHIRGPLTGRGEWAYRNLSLGSKGNLVQLVQNRLQAAGLYHGKMDGIYGKKTEAAVKQFQKLRGLPVTGNVGRKMYLELGLLE